MTQFNTDLTDAPRGGELVLLALPGNKVIQSYWCKPKIDPEHWCFLSHKSVPIAWAPWPTYEPGAVVQPMGVDTAGIEFLAACDGVGGEA